MLNAKLDKVMETWRVEHDLPPFTWERISVARDGKPAVRVSWEDQGLSVTLMAKGCLCWYEKGVGGYFTHGQFFADIATTIQWLQEKGLDIRPEPERFGMPKAIKDEVTHEGRMWHYRPDPVYCWIRLTQSGDWWASRGWGNANKYPSCKEACEALK